MPKTFGEPLNISPPQQKLNPKTRALLERMLTISPETIRKIEEMELQFLLNQARARNNPTLGC